MRPTHEPPNRGQLKVYFTSLIDVQMLKLPKDTQTEKIGDNEDQNEKCPHSFLIDANML